MLEIFELYNREVREIFVYRHTETIEYVKHLPTFKKITNFTGEWFESSYDKINF